MSGARGLMLSSALLLCSGRSVHSPVAIRGTEPPPRHPAAVLTITAIAFVSLTAVIWVFGTVTLDQQAFETIIGLATPGVVRVMKVVNYAGEKLVLIPAMVVLYVVFRRARRQWWIWAALMVAARIAERLV